MPRRSNPILAIPVSVFVALLLTVLPLPESLAYWRPEWVALVLVFWVQNEPAWIGVWFAFLLGLLLAEPTHTPFGMYSLMLAVLAYLVRLANRWVSVFSLVQTSGLVLVLVLMELLVKFAILSVEGLMPNSLMFWLPALSSALVWPTVMLSLRRWQRSRI